MLMKKIKMTASLLAFIMILPSAPLALAQGSAGDYFADIGTKFGRGLLNTVGSLAEWPCTVKKETEDRGAVGILTGTGVGLIRMLRRLLNGVTEVATFMIPMEATIAPVCQGEGIMIQ